jgi:hypothetical protein
MSITTRALAAIGSVGVASFASADVISYTHYYSEDGDVAGDVSESTSTPNFPATREFEAFASDFFNADLQQFDPSLGTLQTVNFAYSFSFTASGTLRSGDAYSSTEAANRVHLAYGATMYADGESFSGDGGGLTENGTAGEFVTFTSSVSTVDVATDGLPYVGDGILQGTGTWAFTWPSAVTGFVGDSFSDDFEVVLDQGAFFTVNYVYEPSNAVVPGPMAGAAFAAIGFIGRRRRR